MCYISMGFEGFFFCLSILFSIKLKIFKLQYFLWNTSVNQSCQFYLLRACVSAPTCPSEPWGRLSSALTWSSEWSSTLSCELHSCIPLSHPWVYTAIRVLFLKYNCNWAPLQWFLIVYRMTPMSLSIAWNPVPSDLLCPLSLLTPGKAKWTHCSFMTVELCISHSLPLPFPGPGCYIPFLCLWTSCLTL